MGKNELKITRNSDGTVTIQNDDFRAVIFVREKMATEKYETVKAAILAKGLVFSEKIEKKLRKELNL